MLELIRGGEDSYVELKLRLNNPEKVAAEAVALANSGGGFIIFGVNDQRRVEGVDDPEYLEQQLVEICREMIRPPLRPLIDKIGFDNGRRILALEVRGTHAPYYSSDQRCYTRMGSVKREATLNEIAEMYNPRRSVGFESIPVVGATLQDIDEALLWSYVRELRGGSVADFESRDYPLAELLQKHLALAAEFSHEIVPTLAGLLLFGKRTRVAALFPRSSLTAVRFSGVSSEDSVIESVELLGNLATVYEEALAFIRRYTTLSSEPKPSHIFNDPSSPVAPRASYSAPTTIEALTNALLHRDYSLHDGVTRLRIFDDRIEIHNPFRSDGVKLESVYFGVVSAPYPRIKSIFKSRFYGLDTVEGGIPRCLLNAQQYAGIRPEIRISGDEFRIKIHGVR